MQLWPFVGREAELSLIRSALLGSDVDAVMLVAAAGVGKTRLARQALSGLDGARSEWVGATRAAAKIPFGAVASLLPDDVPDGGPLAVIRATARQMREWGGRGRVVIGVDDAHLLDDASSALIAHLVTNRLAFAIMTMRAGEPIADAVVRLGKEGHAQRLELPPLPEADIDKLIDHAAQSAPDTRQRRRLHQTARGNPLALRELLYGAEPGGLTDLVLSRLDKLQPGTRHVVELVACGEPLAIWIAEHLVGLPALATAEDSGLIVVERSGERSRARLDHPLYGDVLRSRLPLSRTRHLYRELAASLLETPLRRRDDALLAALWQVEAGMISRPEVVRSGAWQAIGHSDLALAERLARAARAAEPGGEADVLLAEILGYRGRTHEAAQVLSAAPPPEPADRVAWAITRAEALYWSGEDGDTAWATLDTAGGHATAEASRSWLLFFDARCADAAHVARSVMDRAGAEPKALIWAAAAGAAATGFQGRLDEARQLHERGAALAKAHTDALPWGVLEVDTGLCLAHLACGQPATAQAISAAGYQDVLDGAAMMVRGWAFHGGLAALARGHLVEADRLLAEAITGFEANDTFRLTRCCLAARAAVAALRRHPGAGPLLSKADALTQPSNKIFEPWIETWRAWVAYAGGDLPTAAATATQAAELARRAAMPAVEALARYDLARLGYRPDLSRLDAIDHELAELLAGMARALADDDGANALESGGRKLVARGYDLHAAEAYTAAAHHHHRHGRTARAELAQAHAARLSAAFPDARTPLLQSGHLTSVLTHREREVLLLAAEHTSAQIAQRLRLAVPTVNNNLARAYTKLGISSRAQLRALLKGE